uniref:Uncharacterized protein n=1 Tax=Anguilla anguilla TaxID=7936 RepID=A0A0E9W745_ANGAN
MKNIEKSRKKLSKKKILGKGTKERETGHQEETFHTSSVKSKKDKNDKTTCWRKVSATMQAQL